jgi:hypothetical protein
MARTVRCDVCRITLRITGPEEKTMNTHEGESTAPVHAERYAASFIAGLRFGIPCTDAVYESRTRVIV